MKATRTYLDHNASTPLRPEARDAMLAAFDRGGNPSSIHAEGRAAREILESARETVAGLFNVKSAQIYFTSGGTEAANWLLRPKNSTQQLIVSPTEHACVLRGHSFESNAVEAVPVSADGVVDLAALAVRLECLESPIVAVQAANSETGAIQPFAEIVELARSLGAIFICDAVQAVGRISPDGLEHVHAFFLSAHKFGGSQGVGAVIFVDENFVPYPLLRGGGQERRQRSGTENVAGIAGLAVALKAAFADPAPIHNQLGRLQAQLEAGLRSIDPEVVIFSEAAPRLPNTTFFSIPGLRAEMLLMAFDLDGVAVSTGSACSSGKVERSHVLEAMGVPHHLSDGAIRVSTGWDSESADIERFLGVLTKICINRRGLRAA